MEWLVGALQWTAEVLGQQRETLLKLCLATALGALIGLEREASGKPAGFRTNLLICLGAALLTDLSRFMALEPGTTTAFRSDPARIAAQVVSGMGFLGAGTIMKARGAVTGLTTAVTLWVVAAIGMAVGAGAYVAALVATGLVMLALLLLGKLEDRLVRHHNSERTVEVVFGAREVELPHVQEMLTAARLEVLSVSVSSNHGMHTAAFQTRGAQERYPRVLHELLAEHGVHRVSLL